MTRDTRTQIITVFVLVACLLASGTLAVGLTSSVGRNKLGYADRAEDGDPPQVALGIAMGAFRGLFVNVLWIRANNLKEAGRYHEAMDLASAITKLQPRFPQVWAFHAWNMAYNISVTTQTRSERWMWVQKGIALMRDEGIPANPNDMVLHKELAWIFLHKIQGYTDDANQYYKRQLAGEWTVVLGPPPVSDMRNSEISTKRYADWMRSFAEAPDTMEALEKLNPAAKTLADRLRDEIGLRPDRQLLQRYEMLRIIGGSSQRGFLDQAMDPAQKAMLALMEDREYADAWTDLLRHIRRRVLIDEYHMEPDRMVRYTERYGPIDWRHPAAHSLYWSVRGVENATLRRTRLNERDFDLLNTDRVVVQSLQELWRSGEIYFDFLGYAMDPGAASSFYMTVPNVHFIPTYEQELGRAFERSWADGDERVYRPMAAGYENFMKDAIRFLYRRGQVELASEYLRKLATWPHQNLNDPDRPITLSMPIEEFVDSELVDRATSPNVAREEVTGALMGAFASGLLGGDMELFNAQFRYAADFHRYYFQEQGRLNAIDPANKRMAQMPEDFRLMAGGLFAMFTTMLDPEDSQVVYGRAPNDLKVFAYDVLADRFRAGFDELAKQGGQPFDILFPPPPGLEEHRQRMREETERLEKLTPNAAEK